MLFGQLTDKQRKQQEERLRKELESPHKIWINQEVVYIITDEERNAFNGLSTDEERQQFIESFWFRRDPTPDTEENEYREEHYRRIAYANERFASGIPGWRTDRGRIYIVLGPPDELESHPSGGSYQRPQEEGGGQTTTYPFEKWRYRYLDGVGSDIVIEFVDKTMSGEYRMTMDPLEKDALTDVERLAVSRFESIRDRIGVDNDCAPFTRGRVIAGEHDGVSALKWTIQQLDALRYNILPSIRAEECSYFILNVLLIRSSHD